ncbi:spore germination protein [Chengkuizengella axinellae]|uniref:Spore germination protein n=1 Tax=Chengkuizengella axinellae TaxID=3064388 RepID=A0ABT9J4Z9_9BACL|nr:spore germination protein [Chengkuizengella sp. 2205SS18-9]MDP5276681.1 spore germination protein [Chengkuizengella sp. 2205SS18-9]
MVIPKKTSQNHFKEQTIKDTFQSCFDVKHQTFHFQSSSKDYLVMFTYCEGLYDYDKLNKVIIPELRHFFESMEKEKLTDDLIINDLKIATLQKVETKEKMISKVLIGEVLIYFQEQKTIFSIDTCNFPKRDPQDSTTDVPIKGSRDGFIEDLTTNIALIRKRLPSTSLHYDQYSFGEKTNTKVGLLYIDDKIDPHVLKKLKNKLSKIKTEAIYSTKQVKELVGDIKSPLFPIFSYSGRPDFTVHSLMNGRFVLIVDGLPSVIIGPADFMFLLDSGEDKEMITIFGLFERAMRIIGFLMATFLPGFWVALVSFHHAQIPFALLATIVESRRGVPFPSALEVFIMLMLFEIFREAGMRLPVGIGQTLSVVGGLIIGDAAIAAGITNATTMVIIAVAVVSTYTLVNQSLVGAISVIRYFILFVSSILGIWGFFLSSFTILLYLANLRPFGVNYLTMTSKSPREFMKTYFRIPWRNNS